ncbi:hypothetical protein D3C76_1558030 [compost metagenome]
MQIMGAEVCAFADVIAFIRLWEGRDAHRVGRLANIKQPDQLFAVLLVVEHRLIQYYQQVPIR